MSKKPQSTRYRDAGVDIGKADSFVEEIAAFAKSTHRAGVLGGIGGFGGLFELPAHIKRPVLVSGTDGVGTKLKIAVEMQRFDTIGIDLVAMCVNDVVTTGAEPLFFLDYYATGKLKATQAQAILKGISQGCIEASVALIGGETAEMPGLYEGEDFDLAGFCVGVIEKEKIITPQHVQQGDALIAVASSGAHSNGYALIRKIIQDNHYTLKTVIEGISLGDTLLTPTRIYVKPLLALFSQINIHGIAHITGGGIVGNVPRVLPSYTQAVISEAAWDWPPIFKWLQEKGNISKEEMYKTFNLGVGLIVVVDSKAVSKTIEFFKNCGENVWKIGDIEAFSQELPQVIIQ